jgi:hypothetical protein
MIMRIMTDTIRAVMNAAAIGAALCVLLVGGLVIKVTRWKR